MKESQQTGVKATVENPQDTGMRILYLAPQPFFSERGTPIRTRNIIAGLVEDGHTVEMLCYPMGSPLDLPGLRIRRIPPLPGISDVNVGPSFAKIPLDLTMAVKAFFLCLFHRYDVIEGVEESAFFAAWLSRMFRIPLVYNMDSHISDQLAYTGFMKSSLMLRWVRHLEASTMRRASLVITVADALSDAVRTHAPDTKILQLEDAPLQESFHEDRETAERLRNEFKLNGHPTVVYTGNFGSYQGLDLLVKSAVHVKKVRPDVRFVLVGGKPYQVDEYARLAHSLDVEDCVVFAGGRDVTDMPGFLTIATVLSSPRTQGANTPLKIYDYMQSHRPIVATDLPTHTMVLDEACSVLTPVDPEKHASGILWTLDHPEEARQLAEASAVKIRERYSLPIFKQRVREAYADLRTTNRK